AGRDVTWMRLIAGRLLLADHFDGIDEFFREAFPGLHVETAGRAFPGIFQDRSHLLRRRGPGLRFSHGTHPLSSWGSTVEDCTIVEDSERDRVMARCDQGYLCDVCGEDVEQITESDLYLRYVLGEVSPLVLPKERERHIRCNPAVAQYIVDPAFAPVLCPGV